MRAKLVENLAQFADKNSADGINVDFEEIPESGYADYYAFLSELGARLHADKLRLETEAPVGNDSYDFAKVAPSVDSIVLMEYDEHWLTGAA
ncbi:MAG: glycosyl hydrolase family 18 protein [Patescibacteria group bacterium]